MNEKDLGKAMLRGEDPLDIQALTDRVLRRDRKRVWRLGIACVVAWMLVVALPWATLMPMMAKIAEVQWGAGEHASSASSQNHESPVEMMKIIKTGTVATFLLSLASMLCAALCTVALVVVSRRATLRQVNARLGEISAQLKSLANMPR